MSVATCFADSLRLPANSYEISELKEAQQKSVETKKPIAFLYTDKDSTCGLCQNASEIIVKELRSRTILVYALSNKDLPQKVSKSLSRKGKYIPKVVVFDSEINEEIGLVIYEEIKKEDKKALKELKKAIHEYRNR